MLVGRNISAGLAASTSIHVMAKRAVTGQAAGIAAVLCLEKRVLPRRFAKATTLVGGFVRNIQNTFDTGLTVSQTSGNELSCRRLENKRRVSCLCIPLPWEF